MRSTQLVSSSSPVDQPRLRQLDSGPRCLLGLLVEHLQRQQNLFPPSFRREQDAVDDTIAVCPYLPYVAVEMPSRPQSPLPHIVHAGEHSRFIRTGEPVDELLDRIAPRWGLVVTPASPSDRRASAHRTPWMIGSPRRSHRMPPYNPGGWRTDQCAQVGMWSRMRQRGPSSLRLGPTSVPL